jgi:hypothetical protein
MGVPRSRLLGRVPAVTTVYHYDESGRITHTETTAEPEWTEEDISWHKAYLRWKAELCPGCGLSTVETTAMHDGDAVHVFTVPPPSRCHACDALIKAQEEDAKLPSKRPAARLWVVQQELTGPSIPVDPRPL